MPVSVLLDQGFYSLKLSRMMRLSSSIEYYCGTGMTAFLSVQLIIIIINVLARHSTTFFCSSLLFMFVYHVPQGCQIQVYNYPFPSINWHRKRFPMCFGTFTQAFCRILCTKIKPIMGFMIRRCLPEFQRSSKENFNKEVVYSAGGGGVDGGRSHKLFKWCVNYWINYGN